MLCVEENFETLGRVNKYTYICSSVITTVVYSVF